MKVINLLTPVSKSTSSKVQIIFSESNLDYIEHLTNSRVFSIKDGVNNDSIDIRKSDIPKLIEALQIVQKEME